MFGTRTTATRTDGLRLDQLGAVLFSLVVVASVVVAGVSITATPAGAQQASEVLHRANAGGLVSATDGGPDWVADTQYLVAGGSIASNAAPSAFDGSVPSGTPSGIWTDERYDPPESPEMGYEFPVQSGQQVHVRLYFYDGYSGTSNPGDRVFDVSVEGQTIENFDPIAAYGDQTAGMEEFTVTSDGTIDVDFAHVTENPQVNAIEIVSAAPQPDTLGGPSELDLGTVVIDDSATETVTLTNLGGSGDPSIDISGVSVTGSDAGEFSAGSASQTTLAPGETATVPVTFTPTDAQAKAATLEIDHTGSNSPLAIDLVGDGASDVPVGFGVSGLDVSLGNPTSLDFGPDGRLYVSQQNGEIKAFEITRNGPNDYTVTDTEVITAVQDIPNHDDDGTYNPNVGNRQVTGLTVEGTASTPVIYVTSSDPRIGAGGSHTDIGLDTNSGVVSRLTQTDTGWDHDMLVRGLPRSEENHATNGIQYDAATNTLYVAQGGHTNKGAPSDNFALTPEYALSAAVLSIDLDQVDAMTEKDAANTDATYLYDLPTLQDTATPFGGQDGANMANWSANSPVDVYAPGFRNTYDIALNAEGQLYATDNSANPGWGGIVVDEGAQGMCTNEQNEQDEFSAPGVYYIAGEDSYYGHPNPTRGNATSEFAAAVDSGLHDPVNCDYIAPTNATSPSAALETYGATPQGMDVYPASNFGGEMQGDLLLAMWNSGDVERVELNADGTEATASEPLFQNIGSNPLDVHAQGDTDKFPGTVWAATYGSNDVTVFEPNDYDGSTAICEADDPSSPDYDPGGDADNDGYTNADENTVGTDPCSQASQPDDWDQDGSPDSLDDDDDNDGLTDDEDPFAIDPQNGLDTTVPVDRQFEAGQHPQSLFGLGFTGLMTNGTDYADLYNASKVRAGGATEKMSIDEVPFGDSYQSQNELSYGFQYGVDTPDEPFVVGTTVVAPFSDDMTPENYQSAGMQVGTGDQDNYLKLVATAQDANGNPNGGVEFVKEVDGTAESTVLSEPDVFGSGQTIDLFLTVDPTTDPTPNDGTAHVAVTAAYAINGGAPVEFGQTFAAPASWFTSTSQGTAVGLISTANGASSTFSASWDRLTVTAVDSNTAPTADAGANQTVDEGQQVQLDASGSSDIDGDQLGYSWTQLDGPTVQLSAQDDAQPSFTAPDVSGETTLTFEVSVSDGNATDTDTVTVTVQDTDQPATEAVYRVNAGGDAYTDADGNQWSADDYFSGGTTTDVATDYGVTDIGNTDDDALYVTERYGQNGAPVNYTFPVEDGTYEVTLHFAEIWFGTEYGNTAGGDGSRLINANLEGGEAELEGYDIHADVGALNATTKTYTVEVTDGELNVNFTADVENPKVSAIEVASVGPDDGPTDGEATIAIDDGEGIGATTWDAESFEITNTGDEPIESITLDLQSAVLPDVVFDPDGTAGDQGAKGFVLNTNGTSGTIDATVSNPHNGVNGSDGYDTLTIEFGSFQPGESMTFEMDNDPTSIKGGSTVQSGEAGPISGLELSGSTMTAEFGDGSTVQTTLFSDGSAGGSQGVADATVASAPTIDVQDTSLEPTTLSPTHTAATVTDASQTVTVTGEPGASVTLLRIEGELTLDGVPDYGGTPGYDVEAYEANTAIQVEEYTATVGTDGTVDVPVTLTNSSADGGLNYFIAVAADDEGETGLTSNTVVLRYDENAVTQPADVVFAVNAGGSEYTAADGTVYQADTNFDGGQTSAAGSAGIPSDPEIDNTTDDTLYHTERYGDFGYDVPVANGTYEVTLQFAEIYQGVSSDDSPDSSGPTDGTNENDRVFNASIEGQQVLSNYDLYAEVGPLTATEETYTVEVTDGELNVDFTTVYDNAKVSAIRVENASQSMTVAEAVASYDDGDDSTISLGELQQAISWWAAGAEVPNTGGETISLTEIQQLISTWANGDTVGDGGGQASLTAGVIES